MKAQSGNKIRLINNICHETIFGLIKLPKDSILEVDYRTNKDDGVETKKFIKLNTKYGIKEVKVKVYDNEYEIVD